MKTNFKHYIGDVIKDKKRNLTILDNEIRQRKRINRGKQIISKDKWYRYRCNKCGWDKGWIEESKLTNRGCSCCSGTTVVEGINDIPTTAPWMVKYFQGGYDEAKLYTCESNKTIYPICPACGNVKDKQVPICRIHHYKSVGCSCSDGISYPEKIIFSLLQQLNIKFNYQFTKTNKTWCDNYKYDFAIIEKSCLIETHGGGHYIESGYVSLGGKTLQEEQENDRIKEQLAKQNGIQHYIVLDCRKSELELIKKSVIESELPTLFNFMENDIDWLQCEEYALKNIVKEVCDYKNQYKNKTNEELGNFFHLSKKTISGYLQIGKKIGWCDYDRYLTVRLKLTKDIEVYKNNILTHTFHSVNELISLSNDVLGFKISKDALYKHLNTDVLLNDEYKLKHI
ncbi:MAG: hypothetical protein K0Q49_2344 [Haloplasmataceae bacterium]|nr:hypothetical protein [Haloplasmataceae bacterium]